MELAEDYSPKSPCSSPFKARAQVGWSVDAARFPRPQATRYVNVGVPLRKVLEARSATLSTGAPHVGGRVADPPIK